MSQCMESIGSLSTQDMLKMKKLFWDKTTLTESFENWFTKVSSTYLRYREQIRVLSVFSCDYRVDIHIIQLIKEAMNRFRYVVVEPYDAKLFDREFASQRQSSLHSIEVSPFPHFFTYETLERFDLVIVFGMPLNRDAAEMVVRKSKSLLRPGGQALLLNAADNSLGELTRLLYSTMDESDGNGSSSSSSLDLDPITTPDKDTVITPSCEEEMNCMDSSAPRHDVDDGEQVLEKPRAAEVKSEEKTDFPSDDDFLRVILSDLGITFTFTTIPCVIDVSSCMQKSSEGIFVLSGLMKIDLVSAMDSLLNKINEFLQVRFIEGTTCIPYNFTVFTLFSDVIAQSLHRKPNPIPTQWFPEGEQGPFVNAGLERWLKNIRDWRAEGSNEPMKKMNNASIEQVVDVISDDSITNTDMPEPINLDELLPLCMEVWKIEQN